MFYFDDWKIIDKTRERYQEIVKCERLRSWWDTKTNYFPRGQMCPKENNYTEMKTIAQKFITKPQAYWL